MYEDENRRIKEAIKEFPVIKEFPDTRGFVKFDSSKLRYRLFPVAAKEAILKVLEYGAKKYAPDNWRQCDDNLRYYDAAMRHLEAWRRGEKVDPESGLSHLSHAACNLLFLVELDK